MGNDMSKHVGRKQRWVEESPSHHTSSFGKVVYEQHAWYAILSYRTPDPARSTHELRQWEDHTLRLGPFRRPRNAMVALEREAILLKNRHGKDLLFEGQVWAEKG